MENKQLIFNSIICLECGEQIISRHRHDYNTCQCNNQAMCDGGLDYQRFGAKDLEKVQSFCIYDDEPHEVIRKYLYRGTYGKNGDEELKYISLKDMTDEHLKATISYENLKNRFLKHYKNEVKWRKKQQ